MEKPADLIRRAAMKRRLMHRREQQDEPQPLQDAPPQPISRHASYTALMRSHDRMGTRHIPRQG